jgi:hypothetical protein
MASRLFTLAGLALAVLTQLAGWTLRAGSADAGQAPSVPMRQQSLQPQLRAGTGQPVPLAFSEPASPEGRDCLAAEESDETSSTKSRTEGARKAGDVRDGPAGTHPFGPHWTHGLRGSASHPLIYQLCTLLI